MKQEQIANFVVNAILRHVQNQVIKQYVNMLKKTFILTLTILSIGYSAHSQKNESAKIKWYTFEEAVELNTKAPKKIFIDVYTDWCSWCKVMDQKTFSHPTIASYLNEHFYPVKFNAESVEPVTFAGRVFNKGQGGGRSPHELAVALLQGKMSYPSIAYLNEENQLLTSVPGYVGPEQIEPILAFFAEDHYKTESWEDFQKRFVSKIIE